MGSSTKKTQNRAVKQYARGLSPPRPRLLRILVFYMHPASSAASLQYRATPLRAPWKDAYRKCVRFSSVSTRGNNGKCPGLHVFCGFLIFYENLDFWVIFAGTQGTGRDIRGAQGPKKVRFSQPSWVRSSPGTHKEGTTVKKPLPQERSVVFLL